MFNTPVMQGWYFNPKTTPSTTTNGTLYGSSTDIAGLASAASGTTGVWDTTGTYPELINNRGKIA